MTATDTVFAGSIPANYDRYMVPLIFAPYAELVAGRAKRSARAEFSRQPPAPEWSPKRCTAALPDAEIIATDLNPPMLEQAAQRVSRRRTSVSSRPTRWTCRSTTTASTWSSASSA